MSICQILLKTRIYFLLQTVQNRKRINLNFSRSKYINIIRFNYCHLQVSFIANFLELPGFSVIPMVGTINVKVIVKSTESNLKYGQLFTCQFSRCYSKVCKVSRSTLMYKFLMNSLLGGSAKHYC
jgi:hypothetical protein